MSISPLKNLIVSNPKMYAALQNFLIVDPERQIPLLDDVNKLLTKGDEAKAQGNRMTARADYEIAAKIEIYKQNKESARTFLVLAEGVSDIGQPHYEYQETMLADMDTVMRISNEFQDFVPHQLK
ncbi:MAG TPA: hypothetical protein VN739_10430 [Nitrososphaerales archaeon]|nr:hypothetical protein [Nitrososphaerales archaeon]